MSAEPSTQAVLIDAAKTATLDQLGKILTSTKASFLTTFRDFVKPTDLARVEWLLEAASAAKVAQFSAGTPEEAQDLADEYDAYMRGIETIGNKYVIQGEARAGLLLRSTAHLLIAGFFAVAGGVLQVGLGIAIPGVGSLVGAGLNVGLQKVVAHFLGD